MARAMRGRISVLAATVFVVAFTCALLELAVRPGLAQDLGNPKYRLQSRPGPDRKEGIEPLERSGAYLDLVSVFFQVPVMPSGPPGDKLRLGFFLTEAQRQVRIRVRDYDRFKEEKYHYWMIPDRSAFEKGFQEFAWDAVVARELRIRLEDLGAVAELGGHGIKTVAPLLLQAVPIPARIRPQGVRFVFVPNETMTVEYSVHPKGSSAQFLLQSRAETWPKGQRSAVSWSGRDPQGRPVAEGIYVLKLTASVTTLSGLVERIPFDYMFHYRSEIAARP